MFGSIQQFIPFTHTYSYHLKSLENEESQLNSHKLKNKVSPLHYETADKSQLLQGKKKAKKTYKPSHQIMSWAFHQAIPPKNDNADESQIHWIEGKPIKKETLKRNHKLLKAIVIAREQEMVDTSKTPFERSMDRIVSAYSRIKTQPILAFFPPKIQTKYLRSEPEIQSKSRGYSCPVNGVKKLEIEKSISWAKKRNKNYGSFYSQLGKSIELAEKEGHGKSNYKLQEEKKLRESQLHRRKFRKKFLHQIEKRLNQHTKFQ